MRKLLFLSPLMFFALPTHAQTVQCQATAGQWGPCPLNASVQLFTTTSATGTATATAQKVYNFSMSGSLVVTYASITGSPATCTLQVKSGDSLGNLINNGAAVSTSPVNGTTSTQFIAASGQQTGDQISVVYSCGTYPSTGTISLEFIPYSPQPITSNGVKVDGSGVTQPISAASLPAVALTIPSSILSGQQAVTGTAVALASNTLAKGICVQALSTNTISVFVGPSGVTTSTGIELPSKASYCVAVSNSNAIFVVASTTGASVTWSGN